MKSRIRSKELIQLSKSPIGRVIVVTGARQVGKSTLLKALFPSYSHVSFDDPIKRNIYAQWTADDFMARSSTWVFDEAQKMPGIFDTVKAIHDTWPQARILLSGSSRIMLINGVRESLAGRATVVELFPLTLPEMSREGISETVPPSRLIDLLSGKIDRKELAGAVPLLDEKYARAKADFSRVLLQGQMPVLYNDTLTSEEGTRWLEDYIAAYLQRDLRDIGNVRDLGAFVKAERALASRSAQQVNFSDIGRLSGISPGTVRTYMNYLSMSYHVFTLPAFSRNAGKRLSKMPKCIFTDIGILATLSRGCAPAHGAVFETAVIAEIIKQTTSYRVQVDYSYLRTPDGREVDLLVETDAGFFAFEIKSCERVNQTDARHLRDLDVILDKPLCAAFVLSADDTVADLGNGVLALPAPWFLGM